MISNDYVPEWESTPFQHMQYTLVRNQDQFDLLFDDVKNTEKFMDTHGDCCVGFYNNYQFAIVQLGECDNRSIHQIHGLLLHEAVHIWQRLRTVMGEDEPSKEFEAYSVQRIAQDLFYAFEESEINDGMEKQTD